MGMPFSKVIVCGGGTMGRGIAQQAAQCGKQVVLFDVNAETLVQAEKAIVQNVEKLVQRQKLTPEQRDDIFARLVYTTASQL
ncbi:MAG: 3-hydroxybutyryl-CoA dehydrogenase, partial [Bacteroidetes bacterium]